MMNPDFEAAMDDFLCQMQRLVAWTSVGASTVRGQNTPGLVARLRELLTEVDLSKLTSSQPQDFPSFLDSETRRIERRMPAHARKWGIARKVLNIFLRAATYNHFLRSAHNLDRFEEVLELPMDSLTAKGLRSRSSPRTLPRWQGVKHLTPVEHERFQVRALEIADELKTARVHLDIYLFLERG